MAVLVLVPKIVSGTGLSGLWSSKNGLQLDQTELPQHYHEHQKCGHEKTPVRKVLTEGQVWWGTWCGIPQQVQKHVLVWK